MIEMQIHVAAVRALAAPEPPSATAAAARLPDGVLPASVLAAALAREAAQRGAPYDTLCEHLDMLDDILEEMHAPQHQR